MLNCRISEFFVICYNQKKISLFNIILLYCLLICVLFWFKFKHFYFAVVINHTAESSKIMLYPNVLKYWDT